MAKTKPRRCKCCVLYDLYVTMLASGWPVWWCGLCDREPGYDHGGK